jgi:hypothetical protein
MPDNLPSRRIGREALERIIQRAAELQAGEMDTGDGVSEQELLKLGGEVGIDGRFLRQAMYEEQAGAATAERGLLAAWVGSAQVTAARVVPGDRHDVDAAIEQWMTDGEALAVKRRLPDRTVWERQRGFFAEMKRGFGVGGLRYELARALDVTAAVTQLEAGFCHVELIADLRPTRAGFAAGSGIATGSGLVAGAVILAASHLVIPGLLIGGALLGAGGGIGALVVRGYRNAAARMQLALEQVLDRLERGEIRSRHQLDGPRASAFGRIADEVRKAITEISEVSRSSRRLPPAP